jgi:hypothetical protein
MFEHSIKLEIMKKMERFMLNLIKGNKNKTILRRPHSLENFEIPLKNFTSINFTGNSWQLMLSKILHKSKKVNLLKKLLKKLSNSMMNHKKKS